MPTRKRGRRGRLRNRVRNYWVKDLNVDEETADEVAELVSRGTPGVGSKVGAIIASIYLLFGAFLTGAMGAPFWVTMMFLIFWGLVTWAIITSPRKTVKLAHEKAVNQQELEALLPTARGRLERMYLNLALDIQRADIPSESAQNDIRAALRHIGDVISRLPADPVSTQDATALRREALELRQQASGEHDSVVASSLYRQAEALERRAALVAQNSRSARRATALRREARTQMDSLRSVLVAYSQMGHMDTAAAGQLAEAVQRVSTEAQALGLAQQELEAEEIERLFGGHVPLEPLAPIVQPAPPQVVQQVSATHQPAQSPPPGQPTPQSPTTSSRQWWRGGGGNVG